MLAHSSVTKPNSVDDLMTSDDMDASRWNSVELKLPDLSQPARNVDTDVDASLNMDLVSFGMSVARLTTQQVRVPCLPVCVLTEGGDRELRASRLLFCVQVGSGFFRGISAPSPHLCGVHCSPAEACCGALTTRGPSNASFLFLTT